MRAMRVVACLALMAISSIAHAEGDYRPTDRFFWGIQGGAVVEEMASGPGVMGTSASGGFGFDISYWGNDFFALRMAWQHTSYADDWGLDVLGAVPLRYVQLYGGPHIGYRTASGDTEPDVHLLVGAQAYLGRNVRLFAQLDDVAIDVARLGPFHRTAVYGGLRWSPDYWKSMRPVNKADTVWWTMALTFVCWGVASL
jgi:hypothetical protein